ncbi:MAG: GNAT family N-acetyltransferase [Terracidiphilus sp.]
MATGATIEILDLRHFAAPLLRPLLDAEAALWRRRLHWDYRVSARLLMQYLDNHTLPGYAALEAGQVTGYAFCVYEETKAIVGDLFAIPSPGAGWESALRADPAGETRECEVETILLRHLLELLVNSPQVNRVESQLLLHPSGSHTGTFRQAGFQIYQRLFLTRPLEGFLTRPAQNLPAPFELRPWRDEDLAAAARLIESAYRGHPDSVVNDQYRSVQGSLRFLNNIVRYSGCGTFAALASYVVEDRRSRELAAMVLSSRVSPESGHITQICVHPEARRRGLARTLLGLAAYCFLRQGAGEVSLTVTAANSGAIELYHSEGYHLAHQFDAAVWQRGIPA